MSERSARKFSRTPKCGQRLPYVMALRVDGTGTASILEGGSDCTLTDNGTGDYTLTFRQAFRRTPVITVSALTAAIHCQVFAISTSSVQIKTFAVDGTTATDADFHVMIFGFDAADAV